MKNENTRNTIIFIVCSVLILGIYWFTVLRPQAERRAAQQSAQTQEGQGSQAQQERAGRMRVHETELKR